MKKNNGRLLLYFRQPPEKVRYIWGDQYLIPWIRKIIKGKKIGGVERVFVNLCKSFDRLGIPYEKNLNFDNIEVSDRIICLGRDKYSLKGYNKQNPIIAGIGLMTHPSEWPNLFEEFPVKVYLQHSEWTLSIYQKYYKNCAIWPVGIDTEEWKPIEGKKEFDVLIYDKIMWPQSNQEDLLKNITEYLNNENISFKIVKYGNYSSQHYKSVLTQCKSMIFLCEHESQGIAYQECLSMGVPVLAWDQGFWRDPNRFKWGDEIVPSTSVPFFDERCGSRFKTFSDFKTVFPMFSNEVKKSSYSPRDYILENLTLEKSAEKMLQIIDEVYN